MRDLELQVTVPALPSGGDQFILLPAFVIAILMFCLLPFFIYVMLYEKHPPLCFPCTDANQ